MKTKITIYSLILLFALTLGLFSPSVNAVFADSQDTSFYITNYNVDIEVKEDNSYVVKEEITAEFGGYIYGPKHGILRYIPEKLVVTRGNEHGIYQDYKYGVTISNISAQVVGIPNVPVKIYSENDNKVIQIRENNNINNQTRTYLVEYTYSVGYDRLTTHDEFYFNLLGEYWATSIDNFTFTIKMPKPIGLADLNPNEYSEKLNFYVGAFGSLNAQDVTYTIINDTTITGSVNRMLHAFEAVTIKLNLEENYFSQVSKFNLTFDIAVIVLTVLVAVGLVMFYMFKSSKKRVVPTVEFYPPDGKDPVEVAYILNGTISPNNVSSLIVYFASKGYLNIIEDNGEIYLQKLKDPEENSPPYHKILFDFVFKGKDAKLTQAKIIELTNSINFALEKEGKKTVDTENLPTIVSLNDLKKNNTEDFYSAYTVARTSYTNRLNMKSCINMFVSLIIGLLPITALFVLYSARINVFDFIAPVFLSAIISIIVALTLTYTKGKVYVKTATKTMFSIIALGIGLAVMIGSSLTTFNERVVDPLYLSIITLIPAIINLWFAPDYVEFTDEYNGLFGKVLGFRKNLILVEKKRMEMLLKDNPSYFYDILPYAYVMGITNEFIKKFEGINIPQPTYIISTHPNLFDIIIFNSIMRSTLSSLATQAITSKNVSSGYSGRIGGGFGGGFSGGGFGGGGGRSI